MAIIHLRFNILCVHVLWDQEKQSCNNNIGVKVYKAELLSSDGLVFHVICIKTACQQIWFSISNEIRAMISFNFISDSSSGQQDLSLVCFAGKNYLVFCRAILTTLLPPELVHQRKKEEVVWSLRFSTNAYGAEVNQEGKSAVLDPIPGPALRTCCHCFCLAYLCLTSHISN